VSTSWHSCEVRDGTFRHFEVTVAGRSFLIGQPEGHSTLYGVGTGSSISGKSSSSGFIVLSKVKAALARGLDHQSVAVAVHDRLAAWQLELHGNGNRLAAAIAK
jgi:hypothetical protein